MRRALRQAGGVEPEVGDHEVGRGGGAVALRDREGHLGRAGPGGGRGGAGGRRGRRGGGGRRRGRRGGGRGRGGRCRRCRFFDHGGKRARRRDARLETCGVLTALGIIVDRRGQQPDAQKQRN